MAKKIVLIILSCVFIGFLVFGIIWGALNFDKVKLAFSGTALYTKEDVDNAYKDGFDTAVNDKNELLAQIEELKTLLDSREVELQRLYGIEDENDARKLRIEELEKEIAQLNKNIAYYEEFVQQIEESGKVLATFMFDGEIYAIQKYNAGETISIEAPADTEDFEFLGWTLNNEIVDINSYVINESTTFEASFKRTYNIDFIVDGTSIYNQTGNAGETLNIPANPEKYGYTFKGWATDGQTVVSIPTTALNSQTYYAVFEPVIIELEVEEFDYDYGINKHFILICNGIKNHEYLKEDMIIYVEGYRGTISDIYKELGGFPTYVYTVVIEIDFGVLEDEDIRTLSRVETITINYEELQ